MCVVFLPLRQYRKVLKVLDLAPLFLLFHLKINSIIESYETNIEIKKVQGYFQTNIKQLELVTIMIWK